LIDKIPVGAVNFNAVKSGGNRAFGGFNKPVDDMLDIKDAHLIRNWIRLAGNGIGLFRRNGTGRNNPSCRIEFRNRHPSAVKHLHDGHRSRVLNRLDHRPPGIDLALGQHA